MTERLFDFGPFSHQDNCTVCKWQYTQMCPKNYKFAGRYMSDPDRVHELTICHRFVCNKTEQERREMIFYDKMQKNIVEFED